MTLRLQIDTSRLNDLTEFLSGMEERISDFSVPLSDWSDVMLQLVRDTFTTGGEAMGYSWPEHSQGTIDRWGEHPFGEGDKGNLLDSIHKFVRPFVAGVEATAPHAHLFENGHFFAQPAIQSAGGPIRRRLRRGEPRSGGKQPAREFLAPGEEAFDRGIEMIMDFALGEGEYADLAGSE